MRFTNLQELDDLYGQWLKDNPTQDRLELASPVPLTKWISYGQYTQFIQEIDWKAYAEGIAAMGYNANSWHVTSAWGADPRMWPWIYDPATKKFDLARPNPKYKEHIYAFLRETAKLGIKNEICLHDGYYTQKWAQHGAAKIHPYRQNKQGINWGNDELSLPESKPWFTHVAWKTEGSQFNERVVSYLIKTGYKWLWRYHSLWGQAIYDVKQEYPKMPTVLVRYINENHARYDAQGNHVGGFGGEDKIFQIVQMEYEKLGLKHGKDFLMVNDWMPFRGVDFLPDTWAKAGMFDRQPDLRWFREVHGLDQARHAVLEQMEIKYPVFAHGKFTIRSTDGFRPENKLYSKALNFLKKKGDEYFDAKVPSEAETHPQGQQVYYEHDFNKSFDAVKPVMKDITK